MKEALSRTLLDLVSIASPIGEEKVLCDAVQTRLARCSSLGIERFEHSLVVSGPARPGKPRIGLVGHLDTVRTDHDGPPRIEGDKLFGAGAADMKSGLAVMIELAERLDLASLPCEIVLVFYEREEGPFLENQLGPMLERFETLRSLDLAICLEPSDNKLQLGCMGSLHADIVFEGVTSHSARPWQGKNAIHDAGSFLVELGALAPREVTIDGYLFREVMSATLAQGGRSKNIVPDRFELNVNYRFAPGRTPHEALDDLRSRVGARAQVIGTDFSPAARPHAGHPFVAKLRDSGVAAVEIKQAWTDVGRFDAIGVPAVNFGPGTQAQAHQRNEHTAIPLLAEGYAILERFLRAL